jgi:tetratricopeptide (TPR) repeat protein
MTRRWSKGRAWWTAAPVCAVLLVAAGLCATVPVLGAVGVSRYEADMPDAAASSFGAARRLAWMERYKAPFGQGTAWLVAGRLAEAEDALRAATRLAPDDQQCTVRVNLSLVIELQGDSHREAGRYDEALAAYASARSILAEANCPLPEDQQTPDQPEDRQAATQADERLKQKDSDTRQEQGGEDPPPDPPDADPDPVDPDQPSGDQIDQLTDKLTGSTGSNHNGRQTDKELYEGNDDYSGQVW